METATFVDSWEGRVVEGRFPLLKRLSGNENFGSYLTVLQGMHEGVIHLILANSSEADAAVVQWQFAMSLSHPHLEKILAEGRSVIEGRDVVYVVCERSTTNLAKTIEKGSLNTGRAREIFGAIVDAVVYLHSNGIIHGHLNPSNIHFDGANPRLAINDLLIAASGKRRIATPGNYDAPELWQGEANASVDTWSLGMTMWEAMAGTPPSWDLWRDEEPEVPASLVNPFHDIVRESLHLDPLRRCTLESIQERLAADKEMAQSGSTAAKVEKAVIEGEPRERVPGAPSAPMPVARFAEEERAETRHADVKQPAARFAEPERIVAERPAPRFAETEEVNADRPAGRFGAPARFAEDGAEAAPEPAIFTGTLAHFGETEEHRSRFVPIALVVLAMIAAGGFWYVHQYGAGSIRETAAKAISAVTGSAQSAGKQATAPSTQVPTQVPAQTATQTQADQKQAEQAQAGQAQAGQAETGQAQATPGAASATAAPSSESQQPAQGKNVQPSQPAGAQAAEASGAGTESAAAANPNPPAEKEPATTGRAADRERTRETERGGVEKRVMPTVSEGARLGMRRPVEVLIRVSVNQKGSVSDASYVVPGPGNYFARAAQRAALSWKFKPRVQHGERERSVWMLRFNFGRAATEATATEQE